MSEDAEGPLLYRELAGWWPLLSAPEDYAEEASFYLAAMQSRARIPLRTVLELGSGGGNNAAHMKEAFEQMTLVDRSPQMLEVSRALNPDCEHRVGDMRSLRLDRTFDCVFVHDAICYATTVGELHAVMETAHSHLDAGGVALFAPDYVRETYRPSTGHGGHDGAERSLRYLEWNWDPDPFDTTYLVEYAFVLREADGSVQVHHDRHVEGLFPEAVWHETLDAVGFDAETIPFGHPDVAHEMSVFVGVKTAEAPSVGS